MQEPSYDRIVTQTDGVETALKSLLLLDKAFISGENATDPEGAAAITKAFAEHVSSFDYNQQSNTSEAKFMVDNATRRLCLQIAEAAAAEGRSVMTYCVDKAVRPSIPQLLDLARCLATIMLADQTLFLNLIAEVVEVSAIDDGVETFLYLEQCVPHLKANFSFEAPSAPTKLVLLRICNMMLRRLSRAQHVLLAGRIHIFLSQILPSTDRSAVNANGNVNESHALDLEDVSEDAMDTDGKPVNVELYKQFWSLQQFFQNPTRAVEPNLWLQAHGNIKAVLHQFAKIRPTVASGSINNAALDEDQESLTVKYLSSPKLLHLQLRDAGFRRHFLVQCLILLHACSRKSLNKQDTFKIKQQGEADDLQELLYKELERTPQHGLQFSRAIRQLMHHEDQWADWKLDGAASFERPARSLEASQPPAKRRRISQPKQVNLGTRELTRLWNLTPDNLSAIQKLHRKPVPTLREFLDPVIQEMDPEQGIEDQYKKMREPVYRWEALRQISKVSRVALANLLKNKDQNLEQAAQMIFPEDVPAGAPQKATVTLAEPLELVGLPAIEGEGKKEPAKSEEDSELQAKIEAVENTEAEAGANDPNGEVQSNQDPPQDVDMDANGVLSEEGGDSTLENIKDSASIEEAPDETLTKAVGPEKAVSDAKDEPSNVIETLSHTKNSADLQREANLQVERVE